MPRAAPTAPQRGPSGGGASMPLPPPLPRCALPLTPGQRALLRSSTLATIPYSYAIHSIVIRVF
eukprot:3244737-Pyramimonas_sp.AAC.1